MTVTQARAAIYGTKPINSIELEAARAIVYFPYSGLEAAIEEELRDSEEERSNLFND
jgi:hypothetical protein